MLVSRPCPFFYQVPFVHHEDRSTPRLGGDPGDPRVLTHHPGYRIEQDKGHIRALHGLDGPEDAVILDPMAHPALGANPPAVSTNTYRCPWYVKGVSTASRVVPGSGLTMTRGSPNIRLTREDFPTLGRPITAMVTPSTAAGVSSTGDTRASTPSRSSPTPVPCSAETGRTSENPSR